MLERAQVVISIDPSHGAAVVTVAGPLPRQAAGVVRQVLRRAATIAGPRVTVDLQGCTLLDAAVVECLLGEHERLRARGGALVCEGIDSPAIRSSGRAGTAAAAVVRSSGASSPTVPAQPEAPAVSVVDRTAGPSAAVSPPEVAAGVGLLQGPRDGGSPDGWVVVLSTEELVGRIADAVRRRTVATEEPERSAAGRLLITLLHEADRRGLSDHR